jgi:hypothetical protein
MVNSATIVPLNAVVGQAERRRPGRTEIDPALVPILRRPSGAASQPDQRHAEDEDTPRPPLSCDEQDDLEPSRGMIFGVMLSLPLWGVIFGAARIAVRLM